ncbi:hypothetical protein [Rhizobium phaseoli]|uniref:hypothetical protein n=1 Tax=Rhizobium phaseoli TaxID=396 RepID=UPI0007F07D6F|nr:hypothetical protein [Rhizobium phaseoli]ANL33945.1 ATP-dependent peptidase M41 family domain-containing protein [Rhizobium phaseoli]ANL97670.1 ATP-dependent peptidase M41 family domain-containing protein [Rhizobium phaseoli]
MQVLLGIPVFLLAVVILIDDHVALLLGGRAAEEVILGTAFDGAGAAEGSDLHRASDLATRLELQLGMGEGLAYFNLKSVEQRDHPAEQPCRRRTGRARAPS